MEIGLELQGHHRMLQVLPVRGGRPSECEAGKWLTVGRSDGRRRTDDCKLQIFAAENREDATLDGRHNDQIAAYRCWFDCSF